MGFQKVDEKGSVCEYTFTLKNMNVEAKNASDEGLKQILLRQDISGGSAAMVRMGVPGSNRMGHVCPTEQADGVRKEPAKEVQHPEGCGMGRHSSTSHTGGHTSIFLPKHFLYFFCLRNSLYYCAPKIKKFVCALFCLVIAWFLLFE